MRTRTHPTTTHPLPAQRVAAPSPRVANTPPLTVATTSNNITTPNVIRHMPLVHQCQTRNNNLCHTLSDDDDDDDTVVASNCSPCDPPPILPTIDLRASQSRKRPMRQLASQPRSPSATCQTSSPPTSPPTSVLGVIDGYTKISGLQNVGGHTKIPGFLMDVQKLPGYKMCAGIQKYQVFYGYTKNTRLQNVQGHKNTRFQQSNISDITKTPHVLIHDLRPKPTKKPSKTPARTKPPTYSIPVVEPNDDRDGVPTTRPSSPPQRFTRLISSGTPCSILCQALYHAIGFGFTNAPANTVPTSLAKYHK